MAGPLSRDPLRGKVLMSIGRLPTEAGRVLDHPCDLWPQRETILISESPRTRAEVGLQPLLPSSGHLECFLLPEDFSTRVWGEASPVTQDTAACLGWPGCLAKYWPKRESPRKTLADPSLAAHGADSFCLPLLCHSLYLNKPLDSGPKAGPHGLFPYLATSS